MLYYTGDGASPCCRRHLPSLISVHKSMKSSGSALQAGGQTSILCRPSSRRWRRWCRGSTRMTMWLYSAWLILPIIQGRRRATISRYAATSTESSTWKAIWFWPPKSASTSCLNASYHYFRLWESATSSWSRMVLGTYTRAAARWRSTRPTGWTRTSSRPCAAAWDSAGSTSRPSASPTTSRQRLWQRRQSSLWRTRTGRTCGESTPYTSFCTGSDCWWTCSRRRWRGSWARTSGRQPLRSSYLPRSHGWRLPAPAGYNTNQQKLRGGTGATGEAAAAAAAALAEEQAAGAGKDGEEAAEWRLPLHQQYYCAYFFLSRKKNVQKTLGIYAVNILIYIKDPTIKFESVRIS